MTDDYEQAKRRNQAFVRAQRQSLGLEKAEESQNVTGNIKASLYLTAAEALELDGDELETKLREMEEQIREGVEEKDGFALTMHRVKKVNGDMEVRGMFKMHVNRAEIEAELDAAEVVRRSLH